MTTTTTGTAFDRFTSAAERRVTRQLLRAIFADPQVTHVRVSNGEEPTGPLTTTKQVERVLAETGQDTVTFYSNATRLGWVWLVWGNDEDVISDWSDNAATNAIVEPIVDAI